MSHCDFVGFPGGDLRIFLHLAFLNPLDNVKLNQHISTPGQILKDGYQLLVDGQNEEFLAIGSMRTLHATFSSSELSSDCVSIRDTKLCKSMTSILKKTGAKEPKCLFNLFLGNLEKAKLSCTYRLRKPTQFAVRLWWAEDMFATIYSISTYASEVSQHIKDSTLDYFRYLQTIKFIQIWQTRLL